MKEAEAELAKARELIQRLLDDMKGLTDGCGCCSEMSGWMFDSYKEAQILLHGPEVGK